AGSPKPGTPFEPVTPVPGEGEDCAKFRENWNYYREKLSNGQFLEPDSRKAFEKEAENNRRAYCHCLVEKHISLLPLFCWDLSSSVSVSSVPTLSLPQTFATPTPTPPQTPTSVPGESEDCAKFRINWIYYKEKVSKGEFGSVENKKAFEEEAERNR